MPTGGASAARLVGLHLEVDRLVGVCTPQHKRAKDQVTGGRPSTAGHTSNLVVSPREFNIKVGLVGRSRRRGGE